MNNNKKKEAPYDAWLFWTVTNACNLNCAYCNASDPSRLIKKVYDLGFLNSTKIVTANLGKLLAQSFERPSRVQRNKGELTHDRSADINIPAFMRTLDASQKVFKISFTGGEPFLFRILLTPAKQSQKTTSLFSAI